MKQREESKMTEQIEDTKPKEIRELVYFLLDHFDNDNSYIKIGKCKIEVENDINAPLNQGGVYSRGKRKITRGKKSFTNFAIDRFYNSITYRSHNIVFCCAGCNDRKHNSIPDDWKNFLRVLTEKTR